MCRKRRDADRAASFWTTPIFRTIKNDLRLIVQCSASSNRLIPSKLNDLLLLENRGFDVGAVHSVKAVHGALLLITTLLCCSRDAADAASTQKPNIVFIFVDDQGYYDLGCYGATEVKTPHIDAMAEGGTRFTDYYAAAPICSPSRAGLLTGCYPRRVGHHIWLHRADSPEGPYARYGDRTLDMDIFRPKGA